MTRFLVILFVLLVPMMVMAQPPADVDVDRDAEVTVQGADDLEDAAVDDPEEVAEAVVSGHFWIAVFAGLVLALAFQLLLTGLATALGLSAFSIERDRHAVRRERDDEHGRPESRRQYAYSGSRRGGGDDSSSNRDTAGMSRGVEHDITGRPIGATERGTDRPSSRAAEHDISGRPISAREAEEYRERHPDYESGRDRDRDRDKDRDRGEEEGVHPKIRKFTSAFGLYWLITTPLCAFFAAWLATELAVTAMTITGIILGLTIWGLFFISLALFEATAGTALFGSAFGLMMAGVKNAYEGVTSMFKSSEAEKAGDIAQRITQEVRDEIMGDLDTGDIAKTIQGYVDQLKGPEPSEIRKELEKLLDKTELRAIIDDDRFLDHEEITAKLGIGENYQAKQRSQTVVNRIKNVISAMRSGDGGNGGDKVDRVTDAMLQAAGISSRDAEQARQKVTDFLRSTNKSALNPEGIKRDLAKLFESPKEGVSALGARLSRIDRDTVADVIAQRTDMSREEARSKADMVYGVIENWVGEFRRSSSPRGAATGVSEQVKNRLPDMSSVSESAKEKIAQTVKNYLDQLDRPELNYEGVRRDFMRLFNDPKAGADALYRRLKRMDRDSIKAVVGSVKGLDEEDAEKMISSIEKARDEVMAKAEQLRDEVEYRIEQAKDEAYHQAEEVRKDASTAAWWMVATATFAGIAAAIGGWLGAGM